ncbi:hypothetical protein J6TS1_25260 [Siminovitchia terrae]|uniref:Uncharacterized protein n=1 Tax=Siminovitchia terrae TaxID=1914933 RepID=A0ABQ4KYG9_SIMTE|nr:hypothetical protein [Siminovitchia terrae]GIN96656.1 hypothetical protein J6TS1_25260 [Siminovitchia terrae]
MKTESNFTKILKRKLLATFFTALFFSLAMGVFSLGVDGPYHKGNQFIGWSYLFFTYSGPIILVYGNLVSLALEHAQRKWFKGNQWLYILLHVVFGSASGLFLQQVGFAITGMSAALLYALVDRLLLLYKGPKRKKVYFFALIPILLSLIAWVTLEYTSPKIPPFTKEEAVKIAASDEGRALGTFPDKIGQREGIINDYRVTMKTEASELEKEKYLVVFTETWEGNGEKGVRSVSYVVEENFFQSQGEEGTVPPYYFDSDRKEQWTNQTFDE